MNRKLAIAIAGVIAISLVAGGIAVGALGNRSHLASGVNSWQSLNGASLPGAVETAVARVAPGAPDVAGVQSDDGGFVGVLRTTTSAGTMISAVATDPGNEVVSVQPFRPLSGLDFMNGALSITSLSQAAAPDGSVGSVYGSGLIAAPAVGVRLGFADGSTQEVPTVDLGDGVHRAFAFAASSPSAFPTSIAAVDQNGSPLAIFSFDPMSHP